jgi:hypothetical protein
MDELVNAVSSKTGLPPDQAKAAAQAVLDYLMTKVPAPIGDQIKAALGGGPNMGNLAQGLGGMLGKK